MTIQVEGIEEVKARLSVLTRQSEIDSLTDGPVRGAAKIIEREAARRAPVDPNRDPGDKVLYLSMDTIKDDDFVGTAYRVGPRSFIGLFQEFGWRPAGTGSRGGAGESGAGDSRRGVSKKRRYGRGKSKGQPFLRPAFEAKKAEAARHAVRGIRIAMERRVGIR